MTRQARWLSTWQELNLPEPKPQVFCDLCDRYTEPHRAYHTLQHLDECFSWLDQACHGAKNPAAVALALWFHDAIYDTHRADNEMQSANWAVQVIKGVGGGQPLQQLVHDMILATQHDTVPGMVDAQLMVDSDLAILGTPPGRFAQYEAQIRQEYAWVPEPLFRQKRADIIEALIARPSIFTLASFQTHLEHQAQENLQASLLKLRD